MSEKPENKISKEWLAKALGDVNINHDAPIDDDSLHGEAVILLQGTNMFGDDIYSYVKVTMRNFKKLREAMLSGKNFTPSDFGEVVAAGRGTPPQEVRDEMRVTYNMIDTPQAAKELADRLAVKRNISQPKFFGDDEVDNV